MKVNAIASKGGKSNPRWLDPTDKWVEQNCTPGSFKDRRRRPFFPEAAAGWVDAAKDDVDPFADEEERAAAARKKRSAAAKARREGGG